MDGGIVLTEKVAKGPWLLELFPSIVFFFQFIMHFACYILYLWTYFKENYIVLSLQVKEGLVAQKGSTAHNSWSYVPWYIIQLMYFAISEKFHNRFLSKIAL